MQLPIEQWKPYRDLRLRALKEDPEAFTAPYATAKDLPDEYWRGRLEEAAQGKRTWLLFAKADERLVGMIGAFVEEEASDTAIIVSVYVVKEERGKGISSKLMEEMLRVLTAASRFKTAKLTVNVRQLPAIQLYRRFGFHETGRAQGTTGAGELAEGLIMERSLTPQTKQQDGALAPGGSS